MPCVPWSSFAVSCSQDRHMVPYVGFFEQKVAEVAEGGIGSSQAFLCFPLRPPVPKTSAWFCADRCSIFLTFLTLSAVWAGPEPHGSSGIEARDQVYPSKR